jgi:integrase/recombinase XerD
MRLYLTRRNGKGNWIIRGTDAEGRPYNASTKTTDKGAAEAIRIKHEQLMLKELAFGKKAVITFDVAADSYLQNGGSDRFLGHFEETTGKWTGLLGALWGIELRSINQAILNRIAGELYPDVRPETLNRQLWTPFIAVWRHAVTQDWAEPRLWQRPRKAKGTNVVRLGPVRAGTRPTSYDRAWQFISAMSPANAIVMTILFYTGMRPIELFSMEVEQVNVPGRWITLPSSKIGEPRGVPIHEALVPMLSDLVANRTGKLVRTWRGEPFTTYDDNGGQMKKSLANARLRTGLTDISPYTARHTVSTQLVVNGIHQYVKDQILGHAADDMSRHYTHVPQPALIDAINTLPTIGEWLKAEWMRTPAALTTIRKPPLARSEKQRLLKEAATG